MQVLSLDRHNGLSVSASKKRRNRRELFASAGPMKDWPDATGNGLPPDERLAFQQRRRALELYYAGSLVREIESATGVGASSLRYYAARCVSIAPDGQIWGFRALLPGTRLRAYVRQADFKTKLPHDRGGLAGALGALLARFSGLENDLKAELAKKKRGGSVHEFRIRPGAFHKIFLEKIRKLGVADTEWPFNTRYLGYRTVVRYMSSLLAESLDFAVHRETSSARAHLATGQGKKSLMCFEHPYDAVEIDSYKVDSLLTVAFSTPEGMEVDLLLERIWLIALIDVASTAVLSHNVVYRSEVTADDVLTVIRRAVAEPWTPQTLTIPGLSYPTGAGMPSGVIPETQHALWGVLLLDGALAHLSKAVAERARRELGFAMNWGPPGHFERRPNVERLFRSVHQDLFSRLPSTTGSNPFKGRAPDAEDQAVRLKIRAQDVEELLDVYFARHNITPNEGISFLDPLSYVRQSIERGILIRQHPGTQFPEAVFMPVQECRSVRGGRNEGRRPYIQIDRVMYTNDVLKKSPRLIGTRVVVNIDEDDLRTVEAFAPGGASLGVLMASKRWRYTRHSRRTRRAINSLIQKRLLFEAEHPDIVRGYMQYLSETKKKGKKGKTAPPSPQQATEAARLARESGLELTLDSTRLPDQPVPRQQEEGESGKRPLIVPEPLPDLKRILNRRT